MERLLQPDTGLMFWTVVTFLGLVLVLGKFAWKPMLHALEAREAKIRGDLDRAEAARVEAEAVLARHQAAMDQAKGEAQAVLDEGKADALRLKDRILAEAREESRLTGERARREIEMAKDKAVSDLQAEAAKLSVEMAARILGREVKAADQERLIQEALKEFRHKALD